jgi:hypothetical protein
LTLLYVQRYVGIIAVTDEKGREKRKKGMEKKGEDTWSMTDTEWIAMGRRGHEEDIVT